ncbi:GNAT acetyltransferase [compost metagenome]
MAVLHKGLQVAGASSYSVYNEGIEIEIDTKPEFRNRGLATACGAKLILECLERGLYPGWDAQDLRSVALAEKLGYHMDYPYTTYIKK